MRAIIHLKFSTKQKDINTLVELLKKKAEVYVDEGTFVIYATFRKKVTDTYLHRLALHTGIINSYNILEDKK